MKKLSNFIVNNRYAILIMMIILAVLSIFLSNNVNINYDIAKYLPDTSETRRGMDIMEANFDDIKSSELNVMFHDLDDSEKETIKSELEQIENVESVDFENNDEYNKDGYSLFVVNVEDYDDSENSKKIYETIKEKYQDDEVYFSGSIKDANQEVLRFEIVLIAVACAFVILVIMSESFVEPVLILFTILLAVALNKGSNLIFSSVSFITDSIAAILQMALSMDYSIMLINRYRQERKNNNNKIEAMKTALAHSVQSIASSSVTTIVGLLALIFMSFTIGKDLGYVLAKGVLLSLICIFLCLPGLLILFDKAIQKTAKKSLVIRIGFLGKFAEKFRFIITALFFAIFVGAFILKGSIGITYTGASNNEVVKHFDENNQIAVIYGNEHEEEIAELCNNMSDEKVKKVLCYGNTINLNLKVEELKPKMAELGSEVDVDDYVLQLLYYYYYNNIDDIQISYDNFVDFIQDDILTNEDLSSDVDESTKDNIALLKNFTDPSSIKQSRSASEIASLLGLDDDSIEKLFMLHYSRNVNSQISLSDFVNFINDDLVNDPTYGSSFTDTQKEEIALLAKYANKNTLTTKMNSKDLAKYFNTDTDSIKQLLSIADLDTPNNDKYSMADVMNFLSSNLGDATEYIEQSKDAIDEELSNISAKYSVQEISQATGISETRINRIFNMISTAKNGYEATPYEIATIIYNNLDNEVVTSVVDDSLLNTLKQIYSIMTDIVNGSTYSHSTMSNILKIDDDKTKLIYALYDYTVRGYRENMSLYTFVDFVINDVVLDPEYSYYIGAEQEIKLNTVFEIMNDSLAGTKVGYKTLYKNMLSLTDDLEENMIKLIYIYYGSVNYYDHNYELTIEQFVNYLNDDVIYDEIFSDYLDEDRRNMIIDARQTVDDAKKLLVSENYSRAVFETTYRPEADDSFEFVKSLREKLSSLGDDVYVIGNTPMAYDMSQSFNSELDLITILTMIFIFVVVAFTFKSIIIPIILVFVIQCAVYITMGFMSLSGESVYFIALLIVQSILMGATIDYAIVYTSYYLEARQNLDKSRKDALVYSYNNSIHTIVTSASILILVTLIVGNFASSIAAKICSTLSRGTLCSTILVLVVLPSLLAVFDKIIIKFKKKK